MSRYSRILEKANLEQELFGAAPSHDEPPAFPAAAELKREEPEPDALQAAVAAKVESAPEPESSPWRVELAQLLKVDPLLSGARVGLCPLGSLGSAAESAGAMAQWIGTRSSTPVLIVETSFDSPQLARLFHVRRLGLSEAMASPDPNWSHFIHDTIYPGVKVLPAGRSPAIKQILAEPSALLRRLEELGRLYNNVVVALPNPSSPSFKKLSVAEAAGLIIPVIEPGRIGAGQAKSGMRRLAKAKVSIAAALVAPRQPVSEAARLESLVKELGRAAGGEPGA